MGSNVPSRCVVTWLQTSHMRPALKFIAVSVVIAACIVFPACTKTYRGSGGLAYTDVRGNAGAGNIDSNTENPFIKTIDSATSTFSIDADGGSYALA